MTGEGYHLISIGTLVLFSYGLSLLLVRYRIIPRQLNRKFWNYLLLAFFFSTAVLGLILALKVNYKWNVSWAEEALQWHVDSGVGFALVAIFHLLWHLRYYTRPQAVSPGKPSGYSRDRETEVTLTPYQLRAFFLLLGYISMLAQLVLLREFIISFHGNELVIGIFLAVWMLLTAMGSRAGSRFQLSIPRSNIHIMLVVLGGLPLLIYMLLLLANRFFFLPGYQPGLLEIATCMIPLTTLFTGVSGFLFGYMSKSDGAAGSRSFPYRLDALGSLFAGFLFGVVLVYLLDNLQQLVLLFLVTCTVMAGLFSFPVRSSHRWLLLVTAALLFALSLFPEATYRVEGIRYRDETILKSKDTPYGNLTFTTRNEQITGYQDGNPVLSSADLTRAEESVHFAALQHPRPKSFLLLGGSLSGQLKEAAKYRPERIDYCEADPWIYRLGRLYIPEDQPEGLNFIPRDGRSWLMKSGDLQYDVIISTTSEPYTLGWNRYFTLEFYELVRRHLSPDGIFCMQLSTGGNYVNKEGSLLLGMNYNTLRQVFPNVEVVPGSSTYFIASAAPLYLDYPSLLQAHQIRTTYVNPDYLDADQLLFDSDQLKERIEQEKPVVNTDLRPRLFFSSLTGLESQMGKHALAVTGIISAVLFLLFWFLYPGIKSTMYVAGFTGAGVQIVLIMVMQSFYGFIYLVAPLMITVFMGGIVLGTLGWKRFWPEASMSRLAGLAGIMALLSASAFLLLRMEGPFHVELAGQAILGLFNLIAGILVGAVYGMAVNLRGQESGNTPGILFSADLTGAALGTLLPVVFLLPLFGVLNTFILFTGINVINALRLLAGRLKKRNHG